MTLVADELRNVRGIALALLHAARKLRLEHDGLELVSIGLEGSSGSGFEVRADIRGCSSWHQRCRGIAAPQRRGILNIDAATGAAFPVAALVCTIGCQVLVALPV